MTIHTSIKQSMPPHTPVALSPSTSRGAQWKNVQSYLGKPSPESTSSDQSWLEDVDNPILLTLLAKKHSELDLLHSEAAPAPLSTLKHNAKRDSGIELPKHETGSCVPPHLQQQGFSFSGTHCRSSSERNEDIANNNTEFNTAKRSSCSFPSRKSNDPTSFPPSPIEPIIPLSPDFGPRRGSAFSGTVERRRSSAQFSEYSGVSISLEKPGKRMNRNLENRVLWEAAWKEIDANIEQYADRFSEEDGESKTDLWKSVVDLEKEVRDLKKLASRS